MNSSLLAAFQSIQAAEAKGASNESLAPLVNELNQALAYEMIAEQGTGNSTAAIQSISLSNDVALRAQTIGNQAQAAYQQRVVLAYGIAFGLAVISAVIVLDFGRIRRFFGKQKIMRSKIELGR